MNAIIRAIGLAEHTFESITNDFTTAITRLENLAKQKLAEADGHRIVANVAGLKEAVARTEANKASATASKLKGIIG